MSNRTELRLSRDYARVERAIDYLRQHAPTQPALADVARHVALSEFHLQRLFARWAGITPKRFLQFLTVERAKAALQRDMPALHAADDAGLSGSGRLHDLFVNMEAMTPGEYRAAASGLVIRWGLHETPFGACVIGLTKRGVCALHFPDGTESAESWLQQEWPGAQLRHAPFETAPVAAQAFAGTAHGDTPLHLLVRGTNLQIQVWRALLAIAPGEVVSYSALARTIGCGDAVRAVANAVAANRIACLIPCHRVLRNDGGMGGYRWDVTRKAALLAREAMQRTAR